MDTPLFSALSVNGSITSRLILVAIYIYSLILLNIIGSNFINTIVIHITYNTEV